MAVETCLSLGEELIGGRRNLSLLWRGIDWRPQELVSPWRGIDWWPQELVSPLERNWLVAAGTCLSFGEEPDVGRSQLVKELIGGLEEPVSLFWSQLVEGLDWCSWRNLCWQSTVKP